MERNRFCMRFFFLLLLADLGEATKNRVFIKDPLRTRDSVPVLKLMRVQPVQKEFLDLKISAKFQYVLERGLMKRIKEML